MIHVMVFLVFCWTLVGILDIVRDLQMDGEGVVDPLAMWEAASFLERGNIPQGLTVTALAPPQWGGVGVVQLVAIARGDRCGPTFEGYVGYVGWGRWTQVS